MQYDSDEIILGVYNGMEMGVYLDNDGSMRFSRNIALLPFTKLTPPEGESEPLLLGIQDKNIRAIVHLIEENNALYGALEKALCRDVLNDTERQTLNDVFISSRQRTWETIKSLAKFDKNEAERRKTEATQSQWREIAKKLEEAKADVARLEALQEQLEKQQEESNGRNDSF